MTELLLKADDQAKFIWGRPVIHANEQADSSPDSSSPSMSSAPADSTETDVTDADLTISQDSLVGFDTVSEIGKMQIPDGEDPHSIDIDTSFLDIDNIDLDDDDDSFADAVRKFEDMESSVPSEMAGTVSEDPDDLSAFGLDETMLSSLMTGLPPEVLKDILVGFYEKADELVAAIGLAYLDQNAPELKARAHELKGMAGNFGFSRVSSMCATIESAAKSGDLSAAKDATELLGERYAVSRNRLSQWIDGKQ